MNNQEIITKFYESFSRADAEGMVKLYADDIVFSDPAFGELKGDDAKNMWRMLIQNSKGKIKITFADVTADGHSGSANWIAEYTFSQTGRFVVNKIVAHFEFKEGKISRHTDHFDLWKWTQQALGWKGYLLGWSSFMKNKIQIQTNNLLKVYRNKRDSAPSN
ncbi:MAG: nuclear transport factor 2 family protein [Bacteroidota bacterium]